MAEIDLKLMQDFFQDELNLIQKEIEATDDLYDELKLHFDNIKKSTGNGALTFISKQTPNLVSLKGNKISLIKDLVNTKKIIIESSIKTKGNDDNSKEDEILKGIHRLLLENKKEDYIQNIEKESENQQEHDDEYYDNLLEERLIEINETTKNEEPEKSKDEDIKYVVDLEKNIYPVDESYNILENVDIPDFIIEFKDIDNEVKAFNQYGTEIEIVDLED